MAFYCTFLRGSLDPLVVSKVKHTRLFKPQSFYLWQGHFVEPGMAAERLMTVTFSD